MYAIRSYYAGIVIYYTDVENKTLSVGGCGEQDLESLFYNIVVLVLVVDQSDIHAVKK